MTPFSRSTLFFLGRPFSPFYATAMKLRAALYGNDVLTRHRVEVPVISVGNLTLGGTGKTPLVIHLAELCRESGVKPAVVSRGYRGAARGPVTVVADGSGILLDAVAAGDEPVLIARRLEADVVLTAKKRITAMHEAIRRYRCGVIILDDGFQHLAVLRDLDLVLFDCDHFAGNSRVFPGGELREPVTALQRCDAFVLTGVRPDNLDRADKCGALLNERFPDRPVFRMTARFAGWSRHVIGAAGIDSVRVDASELPDRLHCFCGIEHPERLPKMLAGLEREITGMTTFADHHRYRRDDIEALRSTAEASGAAGFITTEKDIVRLDQSHVCPLPFFTPELELVVPQEFDDFVLSILEKSGS